MIKIVIKVKGNKKNEKKLYFSLQNFGLFSFIKQKIVNIFHSIS